MLDGGREDDVLFGSFGNDILIGGMGNDIFSFERGYIGNNTIKDFQFGLDIIQFDSEISINDYSKFNNDLLLNLNTGGSIKIIEGKGKKISFDFGDGNIVQKIF